MSNAERLHRSSSAIRHIVATLPMHFLGRLILLLLIIASVILSSCVEKPENVSRKALLRIDEIFLISRDGSIIKMLDYEDAGEFSGGLAAVKNENGQWGYIDQNGNEVITARFEEAHPFSCDRAVVKINGLYGIIDRKGSIIPSPLNDPRITPALKFSEGFLSFETRISDDERQLGIIDAMGKEIIPRVNWARDEYYDYGVRAPFVDGHCAFMTKSDCFIVDRNGNTRERGLWIQYGDYFSNGLLPACDPESDLFGYVDYWGDWVIKPAYRFASRFSEGLAFVRFKDEEYENEEGSTVWVYHAIDEYGKIQFSHHSTGWPEPFSCGMAKFSNGYSAYFADRTGAKILNREWEYATEFHDGYAWIKKCMNGKTIAQIINTKGEPVSDGIYMPVTWTRVETYMLARVVAPFIIDDYANVKVNGYQSELLSKTLKAASMLPCGSVLAYDGNAYGVCDDRMRIVISIIYRRITPCEEGLLLCYKDDENMSVGILDYSGKLIHDFVDEEISPFYWGVSVISDLKCGDDEYDVIVKRNGERSISAVDIVDIGYGNFTAYINGKLFPYDIQMKRLSNEGYKSLIPIWKSIFEVADEQGGKYLYDFHRRKMLFECDESIKTDDKYIPVEKNGKWGYVDRSGKVKIEPQYDRASQFKNEVACVVLGKKTGFIDRKGAPVAPFIRGKFLMSGKHETYSASGYNQD